MSKTVKKLIPALFYTIFWGWNTAFLFTVYVFILPLIGLVLIAAVFQGEIEGEFLLTLIGLLGCPILCIFIGWKWFQNQPVQLIRLFYGVEAPLFLLCLLRLFTLRELNNSSILFLGTLLVCTLAFLAELLYGYSSRKPALAWLQMATHSLMLLIGIYTATLILFYAIPVAAMFLVGFFSFQWLGDLFSSFIYSPFYAFWFVIIFLMLFGLSCTIFVGMPSALITLYISSAQKIFRNFSSQYGKTKGILVSLGVITAWLVLFTNFSQQPQLQAFAILENPAPTTDVRQQLLGKSDIIRSGLLNAYLQSYRYVSNVNQSNRLKAIYERVFSLPESASSTIQNTHNFLISPFLYQGTVADKKKAETLYGQFFDIPLEKAERKAIQHALKSTAILDDAKAGLLNIDQKKVWLKEQAVNVKENNNWADIEIHEVYENQTFDVEEIFYYFSLPESAVITGLWLGDTDNLANRFPWKIASRGAAQKVYNDQVRRERPVDPALLEQVGPRQYRLRAFPVPPKSRSWQTGDTSARPLGQMHLWLTYKVMQQDGKWTLPQLEEKRNIFWSGQTKRIRNGNEIKLNDDLWLETTLNATIKPPQLQQASLMDGYSVEAKPLTSKDYSLPQGDHFAVILDTSRSMAEHLPGLQETFSWLEKEVLAKNQADLYLTSSNGMPATNKNNLTKFDVENQVFYGSLQLKEMLRQFVELKTEKKYDAILVISDRGSYELSDDSKNTVKINTPLWILHLGELAPAYDDVTFKLIEDSGGGVSTQIEELLQRLGTQARSEATIVDDYAWTVTKGSNTKIANEGFAPLAARMLVEKLSREIQSGQLVQLDALGAIAKNYEIVTPYSSMIVLVNDQQRKALSEAEGQVDRFDRQVEDGKENLDDPNNPLNAEAVPEPTMIPGLILGSIFIFLSKKYLPSLSRR